MPYEKDLVLEDKKTGMSTLSKQIVENVCMRNGRFTIPENIQRAIEQCIITDDQDLIIEEYHRLLEEYKRYRKLMIPAKIDYHRQTRIPKASETAATTLNWIIYRKKWLIR